MPINQRAWSVWRLLESQWDIADMSGVVIGWSGWETAARILETGYRLKGEDFLAEIDRLKVLESAELEIETVRQKVARAKRLREERQKQRQTYAEQTLCDLDDFFDDDSNAVREESGDEARD